MTWWLVDETDARSAREALARERERTTFLGDTSAALLGSLNLDRCLEVAARLAAHHLADAALVLTPAAGANFPAVSCVRGGEPVRARLDIDPDELPGLGEALQGFPPVPSRWLDPDAAPAWVLPEGFGPVGSIVVTPLPGHGVPAGALVLLRRGDRASFTDQEELFARLFAARAGAGAGAAMSAARVFALQASITDTLMRDLLPPTLEQLGGIEFAGRYRPARDGERIGGDFYDVHPVVTAEGEGSLAVLGDVCGKGLDAAVLTGKIRTTLRALLPMAVDHHRLPGRLNRTLGDNADARFVTLVLASARREGATVRLRLTCAGHPPPLIVRADGGSRRPKPRAAWRSRPPDRSSRHDHRADLHVDHPGGGDGPRDDRGRPRIRDDRHAPAAGHRPAGRLPRRPRSALGLRRARLLRLVGAAEGAPRRRRRGCPPAPGPPPGRSGAAAHPNRHGRVPHRRRRGLARPPRLLSRSPTPPRAPASTATRSAARRRRSTPARAATAPAGCPAARRTRR
ncbi:protein serine phosphatase with GAF(s) sensor(s) [Amycolatopsis mediterranei S699]|uniref:Protein serine phosphatase with GAF(S) sensor(S) n=1 Tax=Amycolatopsis mediterranei (strain S699) TaxID=713604 RepID=A0A9R0NZY3_AMYMS|nr:protein serine phosphatase with GAF(s) sensor(s) [Amycolatopsis mediterranei S699]